MRLYNPTLEMQHTRCAGISYIFKSGDSQNLSETTGKWILERWKKFGIVDITPKTDADLKDYKLFVVKKSLEGLTECVGHYNELLEGYLLADTEQKAVNQYGTLLKSREVKKTVKLLEDTLAHKQKLEAKYGLTIEKQEFEDQSNNLMKSIDQVITDYDNNEEVQRKDRERDMEVQKIIGSVLNEDLLHA